MATTSADAQALKDALARLAATPRLLVALDFDGTVSPLVDNPSDSRVLPEARAALTELERMPDTWFAFVSGRPLANLVRVTEADDEVLLIASHGVEVRLEGGAVDVGLDDDEQARLAALSARLDAIVARTPGSKLEHKPVGLGLHTRGVPAEAAARADEAARDAAREVGGTFLERAGKDILEFSVRDATKGDGLQRLRRHVDATGMLFAGDDVTDEDGFAALGHDDIGIKVGQGETRARFRVADPDAVAGLLSQLVSLRRR
ncbi:trehalose-phosphatase [Humibacter ginsenosidimutans]|uniref:trehalose-phosphatase n=1 Tax=Humibacter ginsenosidimutans TaxID=2599293 RepID=UPI001FEDC357|nr:trehalose-phosphatase [Humibacter ginsenosidimutans]